MVREQDGALVRLEDVAEVVLGADDYDQDVRFSGEQAVFMGVWVLPNANSLDVIGACARRWSAIERELPTGMQAHDRLRLDQVHRQTPSTRSRRTLLETILIVIVVIFLFLGSLRTRARAGRRDPGLAHRRRVPDAGVRLHAEPATLLAIVLSVGLVVDDAIVVVENVERHIREGKTPLQAAIDGRARAGRPDRRDDDHARGRLRADRLPGRPDRRALPRVRVHARRRGAHLGRRRADARRR